MVQNLISSEYTYQLVSLTSEEAEGREEARTKLISKMTSRKVGIWILESDHQCRYSGIRGFLRLLWKQALEDADSEGPLARSLPNG